MEDLHVARINATVYMGHRRLPVRRGVTIAAAGSAMYTEHADLFVPLTIHYPAGDVEQATATPGEKRNVATVEYACDEPGCDAAAKSPAGLAAHKRSHRTGD